MKRWTQIFKAFANINRLKIIKLLNGRRSMNVSNISREIGISLNATSKHLVLLDNLDVLNSEGHDGHVWYSVNQKMAEDIRRVVKIFVS